MAAILVFFCLLADYPLLPRLKENILLNFEFKNEATLANLREGWEQESTTIRRKLQTT